MAVKGSKVRNLGDADDVVALEDAFSVAWLFARGIVAVRGDGS